MKSYIYMDIIYHKRTWFYYIEGLDCKFKTHESICDYIEDYIKNDGDLMRGEKIMLDINNEWL